MKKYNVLKVILLTILTVVVLSWIFPAVSFNTDLVEYERAQFGLFDFTVDLTDVFRYFPQVALTVLSIGMFYGVAYKIPAYRELLDKIATKFKGKEKILLAVIMALIAIIVSVTGLNFAILFVFPFVISLVLLLGYNKLVAASVTVGATIVGMLGTTLGSGTTYYFNYLLETSVFTEMISKIILLVLGLILLIYNTLLYASKTKNGIDAVKECVPTESKKASKKEEVKAKKVVKAEVKKADTKKADTKKATKTSTKKSTKTRANDLKESNTMVVKANKKSSLVPFVVIFDLVLIILMIATFDWAGVFEKSWFADALDSINGLKIGEFPIFAKILGQVQPFGMWSLNAEIPTLLIISSIILAFIYGFSFDDFIDSVKDGLAKASKIVLYLFLVYMVLIISTYNPVQLHFTKFFMNLTSGFNVFTTTISAMFASVFNVESVYVAQSTLPYVATYAADASYYPLISVIFQAVYGLMMLIAPTSVILISTLTYLDISYTQWMKHIWKLFLQLLLVLVVLFLILFLI